MTVTSEERMAIASRLRKESSNCRKTIERYPEITGKIDLGDVNAYFQDVMHFCGIDGVTDVPTVFERLADLIDPCSSMADEQMGKLRRRSTALASMTRIASDMSGWAGEFADSCERMSRARIADDVRRFADRIRQEVRDALK